MLKIGLLKDLKPGEGRVMLTPEGVKVLVKNGIEVFVETGAGELCQFDNLQYEQAGATILPTMEKIMQKCELILQISPPQPIEFELLNENHMVMSFLNLFRKGERLQAILNTKATFIGIERLQNDEGNYPILYGMSEIAGRMAVFQAAQLLTIPAGGKGKLLAGFNQVKPAVVTIVGAGTVGRTAARTALSIGAQVNLLTLKPEKMEGLQKDIPGAVIEAFSEEKLKELLPESDVLIVAVYSLNQECEISINKELIGLMSKGSVVMDISVEQSDVVQTSHVTSPEQPSYLLDGIVYYGVPNIAALVPLTASRVITKRVLPFIKVLAQKSLKEALIEQPGLIPALNIYKGKITNRHYAEYFDLEFYNIFELLELNL